MLMLMVVVRDGYGMDGYMTSWAYMTIFRGKCYHKKTNRTRLCLIRKKREKKEEKKEKQHRYGISQTRAEQEINKRK